jgi:hypothetical protein
MLKSAAPARTSAWRIIACRFSNARLQRQSISSASRCSERSICPRTFGGWDEGVIVGGESGAQARPCDYGWVLGIRTQCVAAGVPFRFKQTGAQFIKDGKLYRIERKFQHAQARKAGINYTPHKEEP